MTPRHSLLLTCATTLALFAGCRTSYSPPPQTSGGGYSAAAQQSADIDKMMEKRKRKEENETAVDNMGDTRGSKC